MMNPRGESESDAVRLDFVGFIVTNMSRPIERVVAFYNKRGTCEQWIKEGKGAIKWTRLPTAPASRYRLVSCMTKPFRN